MALGPTHFDFWDQELFIFAYSNMTKGTLAAAKSPQAVEVLEAIRITLNLPDNTGLGSIAPPGVTLGPNHTGPWDQEVIVFAFSNMSRKAIATSQGPEAAGILAALQHALNLPDETGLGWHTYSPRILKGTLVAASRPIDSA
ncbi:hypothetical protein EYR38_001605 [Pleurotus pulmonarius]|nr:hypothetical protein EYR38_001605 [Pleurotus pulmonarius]